MATQQSLDTVQSLYVAYYGRPADPAGLQYWAERLEANDGNLSEIINAFGNSPEYTANLGNLDTAAQINSLYQQLFGRDAEDEGRDFYTNMLNSGEKTLAEIALTIREAAQGSDRNTFEGCTAIANAFTRELDTHRDRRLLHSAGRGHWPRLPAAR
jgi:plasmid stability protein